MALVGEGFPGEGFPEYVAEVVQTAHERGIVHRDLKPSNMMVIERAGRLLPKLLDFGVATLLDGELLPESTPDTIKRLRALVVERVHDEVLKQFRVGASTVTCDSPSSQSGGRSRLTRLTPDNATIGTPAYMAPEQWISAVTVGPAADLYALAVVAFEALPAAGRSRACRWPTSSSCTATAGCRRSDVPARAGQAPRGSLGHRARAGRRAAFGLGPRLHPGGAAEDR
jgi:serine/threonine protein kinase